MTIVYMYSRLDNPEEIGNLSDVEKSILIHENSCVKCENFPKCPNPKKAKDHSCPQFSRRVSRYAKDSSSE